MIGYFRAHGLGNDYIVLDFRQSPVPVSPEIIRRICDRHEGIGGDGALVEQPSLRADFGVTIYNPDGSEAEKSGNGVRIFARYLFDEGRLTVDGTLETKGGLVKLLVHQTGGAPEFEADMGAPSFDTRQIPVLVDASTFIEAPIPVSLQHTIPGHPNPVILQGTAVSMGNPHFVCFVPDGFQAGTPDQVPLHILGPALEHHPWFPNRSNIQFAQVVTREHVRVRIWERGAGETRASGSSACAVVAAGIKTGRLDSNVTVEMEGGRLLVRQDQRGHIFQRGPVKLVNRGVIAEELEAELLMVSRSH